MKGSKNVLVRDVDEARFREFKAEAVKLGLKLGEAFNQAVGYWLKLIKGKEKKGIRALVDSATDWGPDTTKASEQVDKVLYGA